MALAFTIKAEKTNDIILYADRYIVAGAESYYFGEKVYLCYNEQDQLCYLIPISKVRYIREIQDGSEIPIALPDATYAPKMFIEGDADGAYAIDYHRLTYLPAEGWRNSGILLYEKEEDQKPFVQLSTENVSYIFFLSEKTAPSTPVAQPEVRETSDGLKNIPRRTQRN